MVVSFNTANISRNPSSSIAFGNSNKSTARFSAQEGDKFIATGISHKSPVMRKLATWAVGLLALGGAYSCTPEDINPPVKPTTTDTIPKSPSVIDSTTVVVTPSVVNGPMSDPTLNQIARDIKEAYGVLPAFDTTKVETKGALKRIETLEEASGYYISRKFDYSEDPMRATVTDVITDRDNPAKIDTLDVVKQTWVHGETEPKSINVPEIFQKEGSGWHKSGSTEVNKIEGKTLVRYADGKAINQLIGETPTQLNCKYILQKAEGKIKIISTEFAELNKGVTTGLITPRAVNAVKNAATNVARKLP